jgi:hypothetical protein
MLRPGELVIHDRTPFDVTHAPVVGGELKGRGYDPAFIDPADKATFRALPSEIILIPRAEWPARVAEKVAQKSQLSDIRLAGNNGQSIPSLDQGQVGYCWAHSTTHTEIIQRAVAHEPYVPLSAYAVAATIKKGADEGGWCGLSAKFARERGIPSQAKWPQGDRNYRQRDTPDVWADAALHKITEDYVDLAKAEYDQNLTFDQLATCLLLNVVCAVDFNWWSHSVCGLDLVDGNAQRDATRAESGKLMDAHDVTLFWGLDNPVTGGNSIRILNSWSDSWSDRGMGILTGSKAVPDGALATRVTGAAG